ncbi:hypothetical protein A1F95_04493 [Pyrenophora tritici-repentis]|nr:hypothetical protein A1F95_04493 [Pyrenophora tritici-repentis]
MTQIISKRVSLSNLTKATSAFVHHSRPKTPEPIRPTLQEQLDAAQPAEEPWDAFSYPKVRTDPGHGIWICGCGFENHLIHYQGSYPFKYLSSHRYLVSQKEILEDRFIQQQNIDFM